MIKNWIRKNTWVSSILIAILVGYGIGFTSIHYFREYGWTVFVLVPFFLGLIPTLIHGMVQKVTQKDAFLMGLSTLTIFCLTTLVFAIEGIICIVMAFPIMLLSVVLGSTLGYYIVKHRMNRSPKIYSLVLLPVLFLVADTSVHPKNDLEVKTTIEIDAPIEKVWENIVSFGQIDEPEEWVFKMGIAYPTHAEIKGTGVGAIRYCNFTTGSFVEPITTWDEPTLLQFDVQDQPTPMRELNPFWDVHPPHLDGYFQSKKGQFQLLELEDGTTRVEGTTWYNIYIHPVQYWDIWSKFILHKIHFRVLQHIKKQSEKE